MQVISNGMLLFWRADSIFSNWHPSKFEMHDKVFKNSEAAFMYNKAMFFEDKNVMELILRFQDPTAAKNLGRQVLNFKEADWEFVRYEIMLDVLKHKFSQSEYLTEQLLATGDLILVEASPYDKIWGIGLAPSDPMALNKYNWKGLNLLGEALMEVRQILRDKNGLI